MKLMSQLNALKYHAGTAFFFTKSDFKTTVFPITIFATVAAPVCSLTRLPHIIFWIWLHLLQFNVANQVFSIEEDALNKADRPLPAGRIDVRQATILRWVLIPLCFALSLCYSLPVLCASAVFVGLGIIYNEFHAHAGHWTVRNIMNASGFAALEAGATLVAGLDQCQLDSTARLSIGLSAAIFASTYHVQDFKDIDGDRLMGRKTLPIVLPKHARKTVIVGLMAWSIALVPIWDLDAVAAALLLGLGAYTGVRFLVYRTVPGDQVSFYVYNIWLSYAHALPAYWRAFV